MDQRVFSQVHCGFLHKRTIIKPSERTFAISQLLCLRQQQNTPLSLRRINGTRPSLLSSVLPLQVIHKLCAVICKEFVVAGSCVARDVDFILVLAVLLNGKFAAEWTRCILKCRGTLDYTRYFLHDSKHNHLRSDVAV